MSKTPSGFPPGKHPNSLKNLIPKPNNQAKPWDSETAKIMSAKGNAVLKAKRERKAAIRQSLQDFKEMQKEIGSDALSGFDTMKLLLARAIHEEEWDIAVDLATKLAEYERPKLARQEVKVDDSDTHVMTDEELDAKLKQLLK